LSGYTGPSTDGLQVQINGVNCSAAVWVNQSTIQAVTPIGQISGQVNVTVTDTTNSQTATLTDGFTYLNPGQTTLGSMRTQIRQRCDFVNNNFITDQEFNSYINASRFELYDILCQKFGDDYYVATPYTYTTSGKVSALTNASTYPLPGDFYKGLGVEVALNPQDPNSWVSLRKFEFIQRNLWNFPNVYTFYGITNLRYRFNGTNLLIVPIPSAGQTIRLWYAPRLNYLLNDTDVFDGVSGWEEYIIVDCCIKALAKEESDASVFMAQKAALLQRIEEAAANRDIGEPETVSDSKRRNFAWGDPGENGSGNSSGW
jgi:hypothetical protein